MELVPIPTASELAAMQEPAERVLALVAPATRLLEQARDTSTVQDIRAQARAIEYWLRTQRSSLEAVGAAQTIGRRAEVRLGELAPREKGGRGNLSEATDVLPDRQERSVFRQMAEHREEVEAAIAQLAPTGDASRARVLKGIRRTEANTVEEAARTIEPITRKRQTKGDRWIVYGGDADKVLSDLPPESVDLIVTDPPYNAESIALWEMMSQHASRVLVPSGILVARTGQIMLPAVMNALACHLQFGWVYCEPLQGSNARVLARRVLQCWQPWLAYVKGSWPQKRVDFHADKLDGASMTKQLYRWQQSSEPAEQLIHSLCPDNGLVLDPFLGTGTYGIAALRQGARFMGIERDSKRYASSVDRLKLYEAESLATSLREPDSSSEEGTVSEQPSE